jgi:hypothetical protein
MIGYKLIEDSRDYARPLTVEFPCKKIHTKARKEETEIYGNLY